MKDKDIIFKLISERLDQQIESADSITNRAGLVLATCGIIFTGYIQLIGVRFWAVSCLGLLFVLETIAIITAGLFAFRALRLGGEQGSWRHDPNPRKLLKLLEKKDDNVDVVDSVLENMAVAYEHNQTVIKDKFELMGSAMKVMLASVIIFIIHLLLFIS